MKHKRHFLLLALAFFAGSLSSAGNPLPVGASSALARVGGIDYDSLTAAISAASSGDRIELLRDATVTSSIGISKNLTFFSEVGSAPTLTRGFSGFFFDVSGDSTLTLSNVIIDGNKANYTNSFGSLVRLNGTSSTNPTLIMEDGAILQNNSTTNGAAAVQVICGTLTMLGGSIENNLTSYGISAIFGSSGSYAINLLGGKITGNVATSSAKAAAVQAASFSTIALGGDMTIQQNYKGTSAPTVETGYADLDVGTSLIQITTDFSGKVYVFNSDLSQTNYRFGDVFAHPAEGVSIKTGLLHNRNAFLHGEMTSQGQIVWDYYYGNPSVISDPTATSAGVLREYAYANSSTETSNTIYRDVALPALNPNDYAISYHAETDTVTYVWNNSAFGEVAFTVAFSDCDLLTAQSLANGWIENYLAADSSASIRSIVVDALAQVKAASTVAEISQILADTETRIVTELVAEAKSSLEQALFDYVGSSSGLSSEVQALIAQAVAAVDNSNYKDTSALRADTEAKLDVQLLKEAKASAVQQIEALVASLTSNPSEEMSSLEAEAITAIAGAKNKAEVVSLLSDYLNQIKGLYLSERVAQAKTEIEGLIASLSKDPSDALLALQSQAESRLDAVTDPSQIDAIVERYKNLILEQKLNEVASCFAKTYSGYANDNRQEYSLEGLAQLDQIYSAGQAYFQDDSHTLEEKIAYLESAIAELKNVPIVRIGDFNPDDDFDESAFDSSVFHAVVVPNVSLPSGTCLKVEILSLDDVAPLYDSILKNDIVPEFNEQTAEQIRDSFINQILFSKVRITLVDDEGNAISVPEGSEFEITLLLPEMYRGRSGIGLVRPALDGLEAFATSRKGDLITFTVNQMGDFYLIGNQTSSESSPLSVAEEVLNLWWLIVLLALVFVLESALAAFLFLRGRKKKTVAQMSLLPLAPLLLRLIPDQAILWIVLLGIALLISTAFLVYVLIARRKKRVFTKEKSEAEKRSRDEKGNSAIPDSKGK
jgi:hypothetical protein